MPATAVNAVTPVLEENSVIVAAVRVRQAIYSATARALTVPSTTTTVENAEMFVLRAQPVPQQAAFLTRDNFNISPWPY